MINKYSAYVYCSHCKRYRFLFGSDFDSNVTQRLGYRKKNGKFFVYRQGAEPRVNREFVWLTFCGLCGHLIKIEGRLK